MPPTEPAEPSPAQDAADNVRAEAAEEWLPPPVEGRVPDAEEMDFKARNGKYYITDVWKIVREFPSSDVYECKTDLEGLVNKMRRDVGIAGFEMVDSSDRLDGVHHCLQLVTAWHQLVHDARNNKRVHLVRRTPENNGAVLMLQRREHLNGQCTEMAPAAFMMLCGDRVLTMTRDRVLDQDAMETLLMAWIKAGKVCPYCKEPLHTKPTVLLSSGQEMHTECLRELAQKGVRECPVTGEDISEDIQGLLKESERSEMDEYLASMQGLHINGADSSRSIPNMPAAVFKMQLSVVSSLMARMEVQPVGEAAGEEAPPEEPQASAGQAASEQRIEEIS